MCVWRCCCITPTAQRRHPVHVRVIHVSLIDVSQKIVMATTSLILGHGKWYSKKSNAHCSPIDIDDWFDDEYISVDYDPEMQPDILFNLYEKGWTFAQDDQFDRIIDTTGCCLRHKYTQEYFLCELRRILKSNGVFYGWNGFVFVNIK